MISLPSIPPLPPPWPASPHLVPIQVKFLNQSLKIPSSILAFQSSPHAKQSLSLPHSPVQRLQTPAPASSLSYPRLGQVPRSPVFLSNSSCSPSDLALSPLIYVHTASERRSNKQLSHFSLKSLQQSQVIYETRVRLMGTVAHDMAFTLAGLPSHRVLQSLQRYSLCTTGL